MRQTSEARPVGASSSSIVMGANACIPRPSDYDHPADFFDKLRAIPSAILFSSSSFSMDRVTYSADSVGVAPSMDGSAYIRKHPISDQIAHLMYGSYPDPMQAENMLSTTTELTEQLKRQNFSPTDDPAIRAALLNVINEFLTIEYDTTYNLITRLLNLLWDPKLPPEENPVSRVLLGCLVDHHPIRVLKYYDYLQLFTNAWEDALCVAGIYYQIDQGKKAGIRTSRLHYQYTKAQMWAYTQPTRFFGPSVIEKRSITSVMEQRNQVADNRGQQVSSWLKSTGPLRALHVSLPHKHRTRPTTYTSADGNAAIYEIKAGRPQQEDAGLLGQLPPAWFPIIADEAQARANTRLIAERLWIAHAQIDQQVSHPPVDMGTTACTTLYDGNKLLYTATLGDSVAFIAVYGDEGQPLLVHRLNRIHTPLDETERQRVEENDTRVVGGRIGGLAVSRAFGDSYHKVCGVTAAPTIEVNSLAAIQQTPGVTRIELITTCDGFTDGAGHTANQQGHEQYLLNALQAFHAATQDNVAARTSSQRAQFLVERANEDTRGADNISVAISHLQKGQPLLSAIYDGHGGREVSHQVASQMGPTLWELWEEQDITTLFAEAQAYHGQHHGPTFEQEYRVLAPLAPAHALPLQPEPSSSSAPTP